MNNFVLFLFFFHGGYYYYYFFFFERALYVFDWNVVVTAVFWFDLSFSQQFARRETKRIEGSGRNCWSIPVPADMIRPQRHSSCLISRRAVTQKIKCHEKQKKQNKKRETETEQRVTSSYWARPLQVFDEARDLNTLHARLCTTGTQLSVWLRVSAIFC